MQKEPAEIETIRAAVDLADRCFSHILSIVKAGMPEWDISVEIEYFYRKNGCRKTAFDSIVASGAGSSMPHYITSMTKKIEKGDALLIDMGCEYEGYNSDLTRTIFINSIDEDLRGIYGIVREAQERAISAVRRHQLRCARFGRQGCNREGRVWGCLRALARAWCRHGSS